MQRRNPQATAGELMNRGTCALQALDCARATRNHKVFVTTKHLVNSPMPHAPVVP